MIETMVECQPPTCVQLAMTATLLRSEMVPHSSSVPWSWLWDETNSKVTASGYTGLTWIGA